ncbi:outer membrane beta-barrel protein [Fluviibacter sp.]
MAHQLSYVTLDGIIMRNSAQTLRPLMKQKIPWALKSNSGVVRFFWKRAAVFIIVCSCLPSHALSAEYAEAPKVESQLTFSMSDTLSLSPNKLGFESEAYGDWSVQGVATGMAFHQSNPIVDDATRYSNFSNAQILIQKVSGPLQLFVQSGLYAIPVVGFSYVKPQQMTQETFGYLPQAFISFVPDANWSVSIGNLPSMGGVESTFTYQNINIQRALLWAETNSVSRGLQINHQNGPLKAAVTWNDGAYSNVYNWLGASASWDFSSTDTVSVVWTGALSGTTTNTAVTPLLQNNSQIFNLIYQLSNNRWSLTPYVQYTYVPENKAIGINGSSDTKGVALLGSYHIAPLVDGKAPYVHPSIAARLEYMASGGNSNVDNIPHGLLYGPGSSAWSATLTPTYQVGKVFARAELAYVKAFGYTQGNAFGVNGNNSNQTRIMFEAGLLF